MTPVLSWWAFLENENSEKKGSIQGCEYSIMLVEHC
jgi:hypothetical protein